MTLACEILYNIDHYYLARGIEHLTFYHQMNRMNHDYIMHKLFSTLVPLKSG